MEERPVAIPFWVAEIVNDAFLPSNPNKMRTAHPSVVAAAHEFRRLYHAAAMARIAEEKAP